MIWLVGDKGMLGRQMAAALEGAGLRFTGSDREVDITDAGSLELFAEAISPEVIINCAAYTAVDQAEDDEEQAYALNCIAPENLSRFARSSGSRLIHISTDYVFSGTKDEALGEDEPTDPIGVYGRTKRDGELAIIDSGCTYDLVRTAWLYGEHGPNFVTTMIRLMNEKDVLKVVDDQVGSPTWASDLAEFLTHLAGLPRRKSGIYHYSNEGRISWYDFARAIYEEGRKRGLIIHEADILPCGSDEYPTKAKRPKYSLLNKDRISKEFSWPVPDWRNSLIKYLDSIGE